VIKTKKSMMAALREKRSKAGLKRCEFWLTSVEKFKVLGFIVQLRKET
jgi:hypothetical protein